MAIWTNENKNTAAWTTPNRNSATFTLENRVPNTIGTAGSATGLICPPTYANAIIISGTTSWTNEPKN